MINAKYVDDVNQGFRIGEVHCIDRKGRAVRFSKPGDVEKDCYRLLSVFSREFQISADLFSLSCVLAKFYLGLIAIHPFRDGNRRTAFAFLEKRANDKGYSTGSLDLLRNILFEGDVAAEMQKLIILFSRIILKLEFSIQGV